MYYIASVSFGKDSLAMLLKLIKKKYPLDEVIFYDTGMEFQCIYKIRDKIIPLLNKYNIKFTQLNPIQSFEYKMFDKPVKHRDGTISNGYSWCGGGCRWATSDKTNIIFKYLKKYEDYYEYIGIAADETQRILKKRPHTKLLPLVEWNMTEKDCLEYCYKEGYNWIEDNIDLYNILDRVSCWCCANKNLKELKQYYLYLPTYWNKLKDFQSRTSRPMKYNKYNVFDLEKKFNETNRNRGVKKWE